MTVVARKPAAPESITADVIGRTGERIRLRARGAATLFDDPVADLHLAVGDGVLVDATYEDGGETVSAEVIGMPRACVVEVRTRGEIEAGVKCVVVRKARVG